MIFTIGITWAMIGVVAYLYKCYQDQESGIIEINVLELIGAACCGPIFPLALLAMKVKQ